MSALHDLAATPFRMRLNITSAKERHGEACTTVAVSLSGDIISGSDDFTVRRWNANGEALGVVKEFESCVTTLFRSDVGADDRPQCPIGAWRSCRDARGP